MSDLEKCQEIQKIAGEKQRIIVSAKAFKFLERTMKNPKPVPTDFLAELREHSKRFSR